MWIFIDNNKGIGNNLINNLCLGEYLNNRILKCWYYVVIIIVKDVCVYKYCECV